MPAVGEDREERLLVCELAPERVGDTDGPGAVGVDQRATLVGPAQDVVDQHPPVDEIDPSSASRERPAVEHQIAGIVDDRRNTGGDERIPQDLELGPGRDLVPVHNGNRWRVRAPAPLRIAGEERRQHRVDRVVIAGQSAAPGTSPSPAAGRRSPPVSGCIPGRPAIRRCTRRSAGSRAAGTSPGGKRCSPSRTPGRSSRGRSPGRSFRARAGAPARPSPPGRLARRPRRLSPPQCGSAVRPDPSGGTGAGMDSADDLRTSASSRGGRRQNAGRRRGSPRRGSGASATRTRDPSLLSRSAGESRRVADPQHLLPTRPGL